VLEAVVEHCDLAFGPGSILSTNEELQVDI
jgi:hypothetical protein